MSEIIQSYLHRFSNGGDLAEADVEPLFDAVITETDESLLTEFLHAWHRKGIDEKEIYSLAKLMRERMNRVNSTADTFVDIVGTGGSKAKTFNVSTAAAFVIAGSEIPVAKHGNKAATSMSGSADVLAELGIDPAVSPATAERFLNEHDICFMFAPNHHRLSPVLGKVRRGLGFPTIFNCVGPLCNPASAPHQLIGVWDKDLLPKMANALARLGTKRSWIVNSRDGLDEISLSGKTYVAEISNGHVSYFEISPDDFGLTPAATEPLKTSSARESSAVIRSILEGDHAGEPKLDIVLINAAAAVRLAKSDLSFTEAVEMTNESVASGKALAKMRTLAEETSK